jgi:cytochrome c-type biogenesis protein CcmH
MGLCPSSPCVFARRSLDLLCVERFSGFTDLGRRGSLAGAIHVMMMMQKIAVSLLVTLCLLLATPIAAQETTPDIEVEARALFTSIMSPYCPGSLLNECPSSQAAELREEIRGRLQAGDTREQIEADLIVTYGEGILASPPFSGFGLLSWLGAVAIFLGGLGAASSWLRSRRQASPREPTTQHNDDTELQQRMRDEINSVDEI